jgi:CheY-like chemotaxis protein
MVSHASPGPGETILLVDDTEHLQEIIGENLRELGHTVLVASEAGEALRIVAEHPGGISLLLTDIIMPGMHGPELAERIAASHPEIRVIFLTGSGQEAMSHPGVVKAGGAVLEKPFSQAQLAKAVREAVRDRLDAGKDP